MSEKWPQDRRDADSDERDARRRSSADIAGTVVVIAAAAYRRAGGLEAFFAEFGDRVDSRTASPPDLGDEEKQARLWRAVECAPDYGMKLLPPSG